MKITNVRTTIVNAPLNFEYLWSLGIFAGMTKVIVEVETDEGIVGLGEGTADNLYRDITALGEALIGQDPTDIVTCELVAVPEWRTLMTSGGGDLTAKSWGAIEMALWDIKGKVANEPLYKLLGGAYRKDIPFSEYYGFEGVRQPDGTYKEKIDPQEVVDYCLKMREEHGATIFEGKVATNDNLWVDIDTTKMLREALGRDAVIRLDANYGLSKSAFACLVRELEPYDIRNLEDPCLSYEEMEDMKRHTAIPFSTHHCDLARAAKYGGPDFFVTNPTVLGGISNTVKFIGACELMSKGFWFYSGDMGIASAAYLHLAAAMPNVTEASQSLMRWQDFDVIENGPFKPVNNTVRVPEGPGLGVTLDRKALERLHRDYEENGAPLNYYNFKDHSKYQRLPRV